MSNTIQPPAKIITIRITSSYGNERIYPACEQSKRFALLAGTKTLSRANLETIKQLGYTIQIAAPTL